MECSKKHVRDNFHNRCLITKTGFKGNVQDIFNLARSQKESGFSKKNVLEKFTHYRPTKGWCTQERTHSTQHSKHLPLTPRSGSVPRLSFHQNVENSLAGFHFLFGCGGSLKSQHFGRFFVSQNHFLKIFISNIDLFLKGVSENSNISLVFVDIAK